MNVSHILYDRACAEAAKELEAGNPAMEAVTEAIKSLEVRLVNTSLQVLICVLPISSQRMLLLQTLVRIITQPHLS